MRKWNSGCVHLALATISAASLIACSPSEKPEAVPDRSLTEDQALAISRAAAQKRGYDLGRYTLDRFGDASGGNDSGEWLFEYLCSPTPPPPGCSFMVAVDKRTGDAKVYPGQ